jgi:hypothetical protein
MKKSIKNILTLAVAAVVFTACSDTPEPYDTPELPNGNQEANYSGKGTIEEPYNVTDALDLAKTTGTGQSEKVYIKGKVTAITEQFSSQHGNATFTISDDGTAAKVFTAFRVKYLENTDYVQGTPLKVGDDVVLCAKVTNFNGKTPETVQGEGYLYSHNGVTKAPETPEVGSKEAPKTIAEALDAISKMEDNTVSAEKWYVKGTILNIETAGSDIAKYKNIVYTIKNGDNTIKVYQGRNLDNTDFTKEGEISAGDEVTVLGHLQKYLDKNGSMIPEIAKGNYIVALKKGEKIEVKTFGSKEAPKSIADALTTINALEDNATSIDFYYVKGTVSNIETSAEKIAQYKNIVYTIKDGDQTIKVFQGRNLDNTDFTAVGELNVGDVVVVYGHLQKYVKDGVTTPEMAKGNYIALFVKKAEGGEQQPEETVTGKGSESDPYTVTDAQKAAKTVGIFIKGYIVGYVNGSKLEEGAVFNADDKASQTNLLIAASASETDVKNCMPVQLPKGNIRNDLNLQSNPGFLKKEVVIKGDIDTYFNVNGIKNTKYAAIDGKTIGSK